MQPSTQSDRPRTQAERSALAEHRLFEASIDLLIEGGISGATLKAIGERAGYSRGLATHHFGSKNGVLKNVVKTASQLWSQELDRTVGSLTGLAALCAAPDAHYRVIRNNPRHVRAMYILWFASIDPSADYQPNVADFHRSQREGVVRWVEEGQQNGEIRMDVDGQRVGEQYLATLLGITHQWLVNPRLPLQSMHRTFKQNLRSLLAAGVEPATPASKAPASKPNTRNV